MKVDDAILSISQGGTKLGTCFATNVGGLEIIITCKHIFDRVENFKQKKYIIQDSKHRINASIIDFSDLDLVILIPEKKLPCAKLFLLPFSSFVEKSTSLGLYGYPVTDDEYIGTLIDDIKYKATTPPNNQISAYIPPKSIPNIEEGLSGSPLILANEQNSLYVVGMFLASAENDGCAIFSSSAQIYEFITNSKKIRRRIPDKKNGTIPKIEGIWEFCLDDKSELLQIDDLEIYSRGYIHLLQDEEELHGTAINLLYFDRLKENLFATFVYEILKANIVEQQLGTVLLKCTSHLSSRTYSLNKDNSSATKAINHISSSFPEDVTLDLDVAIDTNLGEGIGLWEITGSERSGEIRIYSHKYKFILPAKRTSFLKNKVFREELNRDIDNDYLDNLSSTFYHVIQNYRGEIIAQCRETPFLELESKIRKYYNVKNSEKCVYLSKLCVDKKNRFKGIDRKLGSNTIKTLFNKGYREFVMNCCRHHAKLYERLGFVSCGNEYYCSEVKELVYPYKCKISSLIKNPLLLRFLA